MGSDKFWTKVNVGKRANPTVTEPRKSKRPKWPKESHVPRHRLKPQGDIEEITLAYDLARDFQVKLLDYADKDEIIPQEVLDFQKRIIHFVKNGPRRGRFTAYKEAKITYSEVLYILSCKMPANILAKTFNISYRLIHDIRQGLRPEWNEEYHLVRRLRKAVRSHDKKNYLNTHVTLLSDAVTKEVIAIFSSITKAREWRRDYLIHKEKLVASKVDAMIESGDIENRYPITERTTILD